MKKTIIISPSGNFYGSEQVLFDFLNHCEQTYTIFIPEKGVLKEQMCTEVQLKHQFRFFQRNKLWVLYIKIFILLLVSNYHTLYLNEGGHIKYLRLLSKIFTNKRFIVHIRMIYDAQINRIGAPTKPNLHLISISKYIGKIIDPKWNHVVIYDPFNFTFTNNHISTQSPLAITLPHSIRIGIIGRISRTKGIFEAASLISYLVRKNTKNISFYFFGAIQSDAQNIVAEIKKITRDSEINAFFPGFTNSKSIYENIDIVAHFCREEGLGRVFLEAIEYELPFLGLKSGGLLEIADIFRLEDFLIDYSDTFQPKFFERIIHYKENYDSIKNRISESKALYFKYFSCEKYSKTVEYLLS